MITIIDYGAGNLSSVVNAFAKLGFEVNVTADPKEVEKATSIVLPGVGSFGYLCDALDEKGLRETIISNVREGTPYLGICLGMQVLFETSEESPTATGLGMLKGKVVRFTSGKVPQLGWNQVLPKKKGLLEPGYAYFANSYYAKCSKSDILAATEYCGATFPSAVQSKNITAFQFHPEKSGVWGLEVLRRWAQCSQNE